MIITVDPAAVAQAAQDLIATANALDDAAGDVRSGIEQMSQGWTGSASHASYGRYRQIASDWERDSRVLRATGERVHRYAEDMYQADIDGARGILGL